MPEEQKCDNGFNESAEPEKMGENDSKIYLSHDGFFRNAFDQTVAESFIKEYLPPEITKNLDFSTLSKSKDTYIDKKLARCYSDLLYQVRLNGDPAYLYFLFEHKSWKQDFPALQLLKNMVHIWETHVENYKGTKKLPVIIPLLIYHGEHPWKVDTSFISFFNNPGALKKYIPAFNFELYDVSHMPEENIRGVVELRIVLMAFRYIFHPEILSKLKKIFQLFRELKDENKFNQFLELLLIYIGSNVTDMKAEQLRESVSEALKEGGVIMGTVFQELLDRGRDIGVKEGRDIGVKEGRDIGVKEGKDIGMKEGEEKEKWRVVLTCIKKGIDIETIAELTDLPVERIELFKNVIQPESV
ncbi:MAG TPA: Rpn family recombination-promoting nuclease/putative transposase [Candidatus Deferrimicrobium sp.]|nr:Rpn family recombination-promoting nuclease/putative transposase [Candidatus Deferrimicrobium sp.]